jgi:hypothetical protein
MQETDTPISEPHWVCWRLFLWGSNREFGSPFGIVDIFVFGGRNIVEVTVESLDVVPAHPRQGRQHDVFDRSPRPLVWPANMLSLQETQYGPRLRYVRLWCGSITFQRAARRNNGRSSIAGSFHGQETFVRRGCAAANMALMSHGGIVCSPGGQGWG